MVVYEGDPDVRLARVASLEEGAPANVSRLDFGVHSGTHVDAPIHFLADGPASDALPLDAFVGPARVVDATAAEGDLDEESLLRLRIPDRTQRVLLKTRNSELWARSEFSHDFLALTESGARHVVERGIRLLGIDYLSIGDAPRTASCSVRAWSRSRASTCAASTPATTTSSACPCASSARTARPPARSSCGIDRRADGGQSARQSRAMRSLAVPLPRYA